MRLKIVGKHWTFKWVRPWPKPENPEDQPKGQCDPPWWKRKTIKVANNLEGEDELDTILHECLHAAAWDLLSEQWVEEAATDLARALWKLGYRRES